MNSCFSAKPQLQTERDGDSTEHFKLSFLLIDYMMGWCCVWIWTGHMEGWGGGGGGEGVLV